MSILEWTEYIKTKKESTESQLLEFLKLKLGEFEADTGLSIRDVYVSYYNKETETYEDLPFEVTLAVRLGELD